MTTRDLGFGSYHAVLVVKEKDLRIELHNDTLGRPIMPDTNDAVIIDGETYKVGVRVWNLDTGIIGIGCKKAIE